MALPRRLTLDRADRVERVGCFDCTDAVTQSNHAQSAFPPTNKDSLHLSALDALDPGQIVFYGLGHEAPLPDQGRGKRGG
jgi:hypothetical protein